MGLIATRDKRDKLRLLFNSIQGSGNSLQNTLLAALQSADDAIGNGTWITSASEASGSTSLAVLQSMDPLSARRLVGELLDLYDRVVAYLTAQGTANPNDTAIYNQMMNGATGTPRLVRVGSFGNDYTGGRYGTGLNISSQ